MPSSQVLIVGAGPTGITAAIELQRAGLNPRIIDKSDHPALYSQALVVQARTLEQFQRYGIAEQAVAKGRKLSQVQFWSERKKIATIELQSIPSRYPYALFLPQNQTEAILAAKMQSLGVQIERQTELVTLSQQEGSISAVLRNQDGIEEKINPRWILGCDGAHSTVRELTGIPFEGASVGLSFFLGDVELDGPDAPGDQLVIHLHKGNVVFMGRLSDKLVRLIVALHSEQDKPSHQNLTIHDFQNAADQSELRVTIRAATWMTPFYVNDRQAKHYRIGSVFLAGDASHIHSPVGGQGMNTGIQDIANLAWKLAAVDRGADESILDSYEEERSEVGRKLLKSTERALKLATSDSPVVENLRDLLAPLVTAPESVQHSIQGFISETAIAYRSSSIVEDHGGDGSLRAGDRMPDLPVGRDGNGLLTRFTDGKPLIILLEGAPEESDGLASHLPNASVVALSAADLDEGGRRELGTHKKLIVVRPDGYIGLRTPDPYSDHLEAYARRFSLGTVVLSHATC